LGPIASSCRKPSSIERAGSVSWPPGHLGGHRGSSARSVGPKGWFAGSIGPKGSFDPHRNDPLGPVASSRRKPSSIGAAGSVLWPPGRSSGPKGLFGRSSGPKGLFARSVGPKGWFAGSVGPKGSFARSIGPKGWFAGSIGPKGSFDPHRNDPLGPVASSRRKPSSIGAAGSVLWPPGRSSGPKGLFGRSSGPKGLFARSVGPKGSFPRSIGPRGLFDPSGSDPLGPIAGVGCFAHGR
jgi:hypothetical protein